MIQVKNKRTYSGPGEYIGRPRPLGNPYGHIGSKYGIIKVATREEAIAKYKIWLNEREPGSVEMMELERLVRKYKKNGSLTLICWCAPYDCHGDYLAEVIHYMAGEY